MSLDYLFDYSTNKKEPETGSDSVVVDTDPNYWNKFFDTVFAWEPTLRRIRQAQNNLVRA